MQEEAGGSSEEHESRGGRVLARWRSAVLAAAVLLLLPAGLLFWPQGHQQLNEQEKRGRQIYFEGASPGGGMIKAYIGQPPVELPGSAATCASCHGADGLGRPEAGVLPSDITWEHLMKRYGHVHPRGRSHPAFTEASLKRTILTGIDPGGNRLDASMPTYSMSAEDINALVAYMKRLRTDLDPGITQTTLRIGTVVPTQGPAGSIGQAMAQVTTAYFDEINSWGGVYHRRLQLIPMSFDTTRESALSGVGHLLEQDVFAIIGTVLAGGEKEVIELAESRKIPLFIPFSPFSLDPAVFNEFTFHLLAGWREEVSALLTFAKQGLKMKSLRVALVGPAGKDRQGEADSALEELCRQHDATWTARANSPANASEARWIALRFKEEQIDVLISLESGGLKMLLEEADKADWRPYVFIPSGTVRQDLLTVPGGFEKKIYVSYPTLPSDQTSEGLSGFQGLLERNRIPVNHRTPQLCALAAAKVVVEGLKKAGRDLSRQQFMDALNGLQQFETGLLPPLSFGPNRRIGALGSHIVTVDLEKKRFVPAGGWIGLSGL